jgi:hypothetical protein
MGRTPSASIQASRRVYPGGPDGGDKPRRSSRFTFLTGDKKGGQNKDIKDQKGIRDECHSVKP